MSRRLIDANDCVKDLQYLRGRVMALEKPVCDFLINKIDAMPTVNAVELPCKIGDTVWIARRYKCHKLPRKGVVSEMFFLDDMSLEIVVKSIGRGKWGVHVFGTCEETQAAIDRGNKI
jgi:hypothetical protein